jgi:lathosterol oxidase
MKHPKFLKNQISLEIAQAATALPVMAILTTPFFLAEVRGYSKLYDRTSEGPGAWYNFFQIPFFLVFTDFWIYLIHRGLHHPSVYKTLHKSHHKWIMPTPYASHAFHPLDGFAQSVPYHVFPFLFPLQKFAYVALFVFINIWTIMIHDGEYVANSPVINGAACHTLHVSYSRAYFACLPFPLFSGRLSQPQTHEHVKTPLHVLIRGATAFVFQLQLWTVHNALGSIGRFVPQAQRGVVHA